MKNKVYDPKPSLVFIQQTNYVGSGRLYNRHVLYNSHELYLGAKSSGGLPPEGYVEDKTPSLYSVING